MDTIFNDISEINKSSVHRSCLTDTMAQIVLSLSGDTVHAISGDIVVVGGFCTTRVIKSAIKKFLKNDNFINKKVVLDG